jgi:hypothetical protein
MQHAPAPDTDAMNARERDLVRALHDAFVVPGLAEWVDSV